MTSSRAWSCKKKKGESKRNATMPCIPDLATTTPYHHLSSSTISSLPTFLLDWGRHLHLLGGGYPNDIVEPLCTTILHRRPFYCFSILPCVCLASFLARSYLAKFLPLSLVVAKSLVFAGLTNYPTNCIDSFLSFFDLAQRQNRLQPWRLFSQFLLPPPLPPVPPTRQRQEKP